MEAVTLTGTADPIREAVERYTARGVTELVYQPVGDVRTELERIRAVLPDGS